MCFFFVEAYLACERFGSLTDAQSGGDVIESKGISFVFFIPDVGGVCHVQQDQRYVQVEYVKYEGERISCREVVFFGMLEVLAIERTCWPQQPDVSYKKMRI